MTKHLLDNEVACPGNFWKLVPWDLLDLTQSATVALGTKKLASLSSRMTNDDPTVRIISNDAVSLMERPIKAVVEPSR